MLDCAGIAQRRALEIRWTERIICYSRVYDTSNRNQEVPMKPNKLAKLKPHFGWQAVVVDFLWDGKKIKNLSTNVWWLLACTNEGGIKFNSYVKQKFGSKFPKVFLCFCVFGLWGKIRLGVKTMQEQDSRHETLVQPPRNQPYSERQGVSEAVTAKGTPQAILCGNLEPERRNVLKLMQRTTFFFQMICPIDLDQLISNVYSAIVDGLSKRGADDYGIVWIKKKMYHLFTWRKRALWARESWIRVRFILGCFLEDKTAFHHHFICGTDLFYFESLKWKYGPTKFIIQYK